MTQFRARFTRTVTKASAVGAALLVVAAVANLVRTPGAQAGGEDIIGIQLDALTAANNGQNHFFIEGAVTGLYPGKTGHLRLAVTNPNSFAIKVNSLTVTMTSTNKPGCDATSSNLQVQNYAGPPFKVSANGSIVKSVPVFMPGTVAGQCQRAKFALAYGGTAQKANP
jgi:hypothetical protein